MGGLTVLEITRVRWHPEDMLAEVDRLSDDAELRGGHALAEVARESIPLREGRLMDSELIERVEDGVVVAYSAPYAPILRAHPDWNYAGGRSGRWLDEAIDSQADTVGSVIEQHVRSGWPD